MSDPAEDRQQFWPPEDRQQFWESYRAGEASMMMAPFGLVGSLFVLLGAVVILENWDKIRIAGMGPGARTKDETEK